MYVKDKWARRSLYSLVMGVGAFIALLNSKYGWFSPPEYTRIKGFWLEPFLPALEPYFPFAALAIGLVFIASAAYCFRRCIIASKPGGPAA